MNLVRYHCFIELKYSSEGYLYACKLGCSNFISFEGISFEKVGRWEGPYQRHLEYTLLGAISISLSLSHE